MKTKRLLTAGLFLPLIAAAFEVFVVALVVLIVGGVVTLGICKITKVLNAAGQPPPDGDPNNIVEVTVNDQEVWTSDNMFWFFPPVMLVNPIQYGFTFTYGLQFGDQPQLWTGTNCPPNQVLDPNSTTNSWSMDSFAAGYGLRIHWDSTNGYHTTQLASDNTPYFMVIECSTNLADWFPVYTNECYRFEMNQWTDSKIYSKAFYRIHQTPAEY